MIIKRLELFLLPAMILAGSCMELSWLLFTTVMKQLRFADYIAWPIALLVVFPISCNFNTM